MLTERGLEALPQAAAKAVEPEGGRIIHGRERKIGYFAAIAPNPESESRSPRLPK